MGHGIAMGLHFFSLTHMYIEFASLQSILMLLQSLLMFSLSFAPTFHTKLCLTSGTPQPTLLDLTQDRHPLHHEKEGRHVVHFSSCVLTYCQAEHDQGAFTSSLDAFGNKKMVSGCLTLCLHKLCRVFYTFEPMIFTTIIH